MSTTTNILDGYHGDDFDLARLKEDGIIAIIHKATEGVSWNDDKYKDRRDEAKELGFLWGAFHFATNDPWEAQVDHFLDRVQPQASDLIAWDWENPPAPRPPRRRQPPMSYEDVRNSVELIHDRLNRYPVLYGGSLIREYVGNSEDPILKNCPLWYARYARAPIEIPTHTWPTYTLWQYTGAEPEARNPAHPPPGHLQAAGRFVDRNMYQGTDDDLKVKWPFA